MMPNFIPAGMDSTSAQVADYGRQNFIPGAPDNLQPEVGIVDEDGTVIAPDPAVLVAKGLCPYCETQKFIVGAATVDEQFPRLVKHIKAAHRGQPVPAHPNVAVESVEFGSEYDAD